MNNRKTLLLGIIVGGIVGSVAALITTPKSGDDLKKLCKENSIKIKSNLKSFNEDISQLKNQVVNASKESAIILKDFSKDVKTSVNTWKKDIEPNQLNIMNELKNIEESIQQLEKFTKK